jgi:uncharacterized protein (DUF2062 family)
VRDGERPTKREIARRAWRRLRGGELTPARAAASVAVGLAIGVTPIWGLHWAIVLGVCLPLRLDAGVAYLASNVSLPFIAPFITVAEIEVGARVLRGAWLHMTTDELRQTRLRDFLGEVALGTVVVAIGAAAGGGALTYLLVAWRRARARAA